MLDTLSSESHVRRPFASIRAAGTAAASRRAVLSAALVAGLCAVAPARADILYNPAGWKFPNIMTAAKEAIQLTDRTPIIPGKETVNKGYRRPDGTRVMTYEIEGKIFGLDIDEDAKPPFEYGIMDADGDGKFETKIVYSKGNKDHFYVPQWIIDYYFSLHPEVQRVGGKAVMPSLVTPPPPKTTTAKKTPTPAGPPKKPAPPKPSDLATP
jgi:hypothetical protein